MKYKKILTPITQSISSVLGFLLILATIIRGLVKNEVILLTIIALMLLVYLAIFVMKHYIEIAEIKLKQDTLANLQAQPAQEPNYPPIDVKIAPQYSANFIARIKILTALRICPQATRGDFLQVLGVDEAILDDNLNELEKTRLIKRSEDNDDYYELASMDHLLGSDES